MKQNNINECSSSPYLNNGSCIDLIASYLCQCAIDYTGRQCEAELIFCSMNDCLNGGTCIDEDRGSGTVCMCAPGFSGKMC